MFKQNIGNLKEFFGILLLLSWCLFLSSLSMSFHLPTFAEVLKRAESRLQPRTWWILSLIRREVTCNTHTVTQSVTQSVTQDQLSFSNMLQHDQKLLWRLSSILLWSKIILKQNESIWINGNFWMKCGDKNIFKAGAHSTTRRRRRIAQQRHFLWTWAVPICSKQQFKQKVSALILLRLLLESLH